MLVRLVGKRRTGEVAVADGGMLTVCWLEGRTALVVTDDRRQRVVYVFPKSIIFRFNYYMILCRGQYLANIRKIEQSGKLTQVNATRATLILFVPVFLKMMSVYFRNNRQWLHQIAFMFINCTTHYEIYLSHLYLYNESGSKSDLYDVAFV